MKHMKRTSPRGEAMTTALRNATGKQIADVPIEHSSMSWLQAPPTKPAGHVQMARPFRGLVSHTAPSLQGLLTHASSRWHSKPVGTAQTDTHKHMKYTFSRRD